MLRTEGNRFYFSGHFAFVSYAIHSDAAISTGIPHVQVTFRMLIVEGIYPNAICTKVVANVADGQGGFDWQPRRDHRSRGRRLHPVVRVNAKPATSAFIAAANPIANIPPTLSRARHRIASRLAGPRAPLFLRHPLNE